VGLVVREADQTVELVGDFGEAHVDVGHAAVVLRGAVLEALDEALVFFQTAIVVEGVFGETALPVANKLRGFSGDFGHATVVVGHQAVVLGEATVMVREVAFLDDEMLSVHLFKFRCKHGGLLEFGDLLLKVHLDSV
jgi:hypothetical protein